MGERRDSVDDAAAAVNDPIVRTCARWLALVLDTEIRPRDSDQACAEAMALLRSPNVTERSLILALSDGRLLDRLLRRIGVQPGEAPKCCSGTGLSGGLQVFVAWCRAKIPGMAEVAMRGQQQQQTSVASLAACLQALASWPGVAAIDFLPRFCPPQASPYRGGVRTVKDYDEMLRLPMPEAASPVEVELVSIINYYRVALAVYDLLSASPLSYWPSGEMQAAFCHHRQLLATYWQIRGELGCSCDKDGGGGCNEQCLLMALRRHGDGLAALHAQQCCQWQLWSSEAVDKLIQKEPRCQRQVRLAFSRLTSPDDSHSPKSMEQLHLMPAYQLTSLKSSVSRVADRGNNAALTAAKELMNQLDDRLTEYMERLQHQLRPSLTALAAIKGVDKPEYLKFESLGHLRWSGQVTLQLAAEVPAQRCRCYLWDAALVFADLEKGDFKLSVKLEMDHNFQTEDSAPTAFRILGPLIAICDTVEDRQAWLEAIRVAMGARYPRTLPSSGEHAFRQVYFGPETLNQCCFRCQRSLAGFGYICGGPCGLRMDLQCIKTLQMPCQASDQEPAAAAAAAAAAEAAPYLPRRASADPATSTAPVPPPLPKPRIIRPSVASASTSSVSSPPPSPAVSAAPAATRAASAAAEEAPPALPPRRRDTLPQIQPPLPSASVNGSDDAYDSVM